MADTDPRIINVFTVCALEIEKLNDGERTRVFAALRALYPERPPERQVVSGQLTGQPWDERRFGGTVKTE